MCCGVYERDLKPGSERYFSEKILFLTFWILKKVFAAKIILEMHDLSLVASFPMNHLFAYPQ